MPCSTLPAPSADRPAAGRLDAILDRLAASDDAAVAAWAARLLAGDAAEARSGVPGGGREANQ